MKNLILAGILVFLLGWLSNSVYSERSESPLTIGPREIISPSDIIKENQIVIHKDKIVINIDNASWTRYADTNSMDPVLDKNANGLQIVPELEDDISIGDIITYKPEWSDKLVVHRVIYTGEDDLGKYFITKGDNSTRTDPGKIRFNQIKYILIGVIY